MAQFSAVIDGLTEACTALETPITGGNVSFYNETLGEGIYPTPVLGIVGIVDDVRNSMQPSFRSPGKTLILLAPGTKADLAEAETRFGSSEYVKDILGNLWGLPPALDLVQEAALQKATLEMIQAGLLESAKDASEGGIAVTLAEAGFAANIGVDVTLDAQALPLECVLFGEEATRILLSCDAANVSRIREIAIRYGLSAKAIGTTTDGHLRVNVDGHTAIASPVFRLKESWSSALVKALHVDTAEELVPQILEKS